MIDPPDPPFRPENVLASLGIETGATAPTFSPLAGGWSGSRLWRVERSGLPTLVVRGFPGARDSVARREAAIHTLVRNAGIPAPEIVAVGDVPGGAAMVMMLMPGIPLAQALRDIPDAASAHALGMASGTMLARIHAIPAPSLAEAGLTRGGSHDPGDWLTWIQPAPDVWQVLSPWLARYPADRLIHLDFHPENVLVDPESGALTAVLDWTNARLGPPAADLARARSILRLITTAIMPNLPPGMAATLDAFIRGFQEAHAATRGAVDPAMRRAFDAWALDIQIADLAPKLGMPGIWLTESTFADLRAARNMALAEATRTLPQW